MVVGHSSSHFVDDQTRYFHPHTAYVAWECSKFGLVALLTGPLPTLAAMKFDFWDFEMIRLAVLPRTRRSSSEMFESML